jgi:hypothetical protein
VAPGEPSRTNCLGIRKLPRPNPILPSGAAAARARSKSSLKGGHRGETSVDVCLRSDIVVPEILVCARQRPRQFPLRPYSPRQFPLPPYTRRLLQEFEVWYNEDRTHLALEKDAPDHRPVEPSEMGEVISQPRLGGLHHRYSRRAA